jgi:hypothetical protein
MSLAGDLNRLHSIYFSLDLIAIFCKKYLALNRADKLTYEIVKKQ